MFIHVFNFGVSRHNMGLEIPICRQKDRKSLGMTFGPAKSKTLMEFFLL